MKVTTRKRQYTFTAVMLATIGYCLWATIADGLELRKMRAEQKRLEPLVGRLKTDSPAKIALLNIDRSEPGDLAWRVRIPKGVPWVIKHRLVATGGGESHKAAKQMPVESLVRCRLVQEGDHWWYYGPNGVLPISPPVAEFIQRHWHELTISIAGKDEQLNAATSRVVTLLSVKVPQKLMPRAKEQMGLSIWKKLKNEPLLLIEIGSEKAFRARTQSPGPASGAGPND